MGKDADGGGDGGGVGGGGGGGVSADQRAIEIDLTRSRPGFDPGCRRQATAVRN